MKYAYGPYGTVLPHCRTVTSLVRSVGQEQSATVLAVCVGTGGLAGEGLSVSASGSLGSGEVQEAGTSDLSRADPGPAESAVAAGSGESAVGSGLESLVRKVGSELVSGPYIRTCEPDTSV